MADQPKISVIIPNHNRSKFVGQAIESVLNQSFADFELIIDDDASSDDSVAIIERYEKKDNRIHLVRSSKRLGSSGARNLGIRFAK